MLDDRDIAALVERLGVPSMRTGGVLLVDDERPNLTVLSGFLEDRWTVHEAGSGAEALEVAARVPLDVVVADQRMPGMTGVELLTELRRRRPDVAGIVLTAYADLATMESAINRAGVFRFLRKPWEPAELLDTVEQACAAVAQRRTIERLVALLSGRNEELRASVEKLQAQQRQLLHLERLGTVGRLSSGVTHDLKNVVTGLRTAEWEMDRSPVSPALREILTLGLAGVENLLRTLQTLHEFVRSGSLELELEAVDPAVVVNDAVALARMDLAFRTRRVQCQIESPLPRLQVDRQKLTQVLVNLVRNALHASPQGGVVRVCAGARPDRGEVELAVEDEGPGVAPEIRERLFQPFASTKGEGGLGMGLYMARLIAESHGGRIALADSGKGARFEVVLPVKQRGVVGAGASAREVEASGTTV